MPAPTIVNAPLVLIVRDGWGQNPHPEHDAFNAVKLAKTPVDAALRRDWPMTLIKTSGEDVGLTAGTMGNSEVGHQNIGAGRIVDQEAVRISKVCRGEQGGLAAVEPIAGAIRRSKDNGTKVHLIGLCSDAGVHALLDHFYAVMRLCREIGHTRVMLHLITDGRDTGPFEGLRFVNEVVRMTRELGVGTIASVMGRYWIMDRDFRWERVARAYDCLTGRTGAASAPDGPGAVKAFYDRPESFGVPESMRGDEFVPPIMIGDARASRITDGDAVIFTNYRGDRPREIVSAFVLPDAKWAEVKPSPDSGKHGFDRGTPPCVEFVTMTSYSEALAPFVKPAFIKPPRMVNIAGEYLSGLGLSQFRCAETEKYPHVTFFFNDYRDEPYPGERRENPQSPKVATYDLKPEMAAEDVCAAVLRRLAAADCEPLIVVNFANGDMVGHTGNLQAAIKACEAVDACVGKILSATQARAGSLIITADHGNAEQMWDPQTNAPHTAHTTYDVPLFVVGAPFKGAALRSGGRLADVIPTALRMLGLPQPAEMTGRSLLA